MRRLPWAHVHLFGVPLSILEKVSKVCLALPGTTREMNNSHATFRVSKKVFVYFLDDHHGDGIVSICAKLAAGENALLVKSDAKRFYLPAYIGHRGWVALRLDHGEVDWDEVGELVRESYRRTAPKRLAASVK